MTDITPNGITPLPPEKKDIEFTSDSWRPIRESRNVKEGTNEFNQAIEGISLNQEAWRRLKKNKMAIGGLYVIIFYALICLSAPILPIHSYKKIILDHQYLPPSLTKTAGDLVYEKKEFRLKRIAQKQGRNFLNDAEKTQLAELRRTIETETMVIDGKTIKTYERQYFLGTDYHGRDMLSRIIYGGQVSIAIGLVGTFTSVLIGIIIGSISGFLGGKIDYFVMRFVDIMYGLPYILIVIIFMALFGQHILNLFFAIALVSWLNVARVVRGQVISLKNSDFVEAARSIGASSRRIIFKHMVPNTFGIIIVFASLEIPHFIMIEAFLSFLGLGISAPFASWGSLVGDAVEGMALYPWRLFFPSLAMVIFLFSMNFLGDGLRDALDPKSKNRL
ncbi:MAG: ABC transporter permease subunit [SAR324 cluster bacterium]|nr:ABC transporter permease subunit [SAR324 cluster bacterium]